MLDDELRSSAIMHGLMMIDESMNEHADGDLSEMLWKIIRSSYDEMARDIIGKDGTKGTLEEMKAHALRLWNDAGTIAETMNVCGLLDGEYLVLVEDILRASGDIASSLKAIEPVKPSFGLDFSCYFRSRYNEYYEVYEKSGYGGMFALPGQRRLEELALSIHEREDFLDAFFNEYGETDIDSISLEEIGTILEGFPGVDRRIEIIRSLTHEKDMVYGGFSTFDPRRTISFLLSEIRKDYYGGCYVPLGGDDASYECIITQLRNIWLKNHGI